jgi:hypothetical protein
MTDHSNTYATNDLAFGAFLIAAGRLRFRELELSDPRGRARIIFADPSNIGPDLKLQFDAEETFVEPRAFHRHLRDLRKSIDDKAMALRSGSSERPEQVEALRTQNKGCNFNVNQSHNV